MLQFFNVRPFVIDFVQPGCTLSSAGSRHHLARTQIPKAIPVVHPGCTNLRLRRPLAAFRAREPQRVLSPVCDCWGFAIGNHIRVLFATCQAPSIYPGDYGTRRATHACQAARRGMRCCKVSRNAVRSRLRPARCKLTSLVHRPRVVFGSRCYYYRSGNNPIPSTPFKGGINQQAHPRVFHTRRKSDRRSGVSYRAAESQ